MITVRTIAVAGLAAAILSSCTATRTLHHSAPKPAPTPTVTSVAELILLATDRECAQFGKTYSAIGATTEGSGTLNALIAVMAKRGGGWQKAISAAAHIADEPGIPTGINPARTLSAELARDAVDIGKLRGDIAVGRSGKIQHAWNQTFTDLASTQQLC